jgi:hypothetical protein
MSTREAQEDRKRPAKTQPRNHPSDGEQQARERHDADPLNDDNPAICRGMD